MNFQEAFIDELVKVAKLTKVETRDENLFTITANPRFGFFTGRPGPNDTDSGFFRKMPEEQRRKEILRHIRTVITGLNLSHAKALANKGKPEIFTRRYPVSFINRIKRRFMSPEKRQALIKQLRAKDDEIAKGIDRIIMTGG